MAQFFNNLMRRGRSKNIVLDRHVFIIKLVNQAKRGYCLGAIAISQLSELLCNSLIEVRISINGPCGGQH